MSVFRLFVVCGLLSLMLGCDGVGKGNGPRSLVVLQIPAGQGVSQEQVRNPPAEFTDFEAFSCVGGTLRAFVIFDDDSVGDFTNRVRWSSNNEAVLQVSNFDLQTQQANGTVFGSGTLVPAATAAASSTATITAEYLNLQARADVVLRGAGDAIIEPIFSRVPTDATVRPAFFRVASDTFTGFRVRRVLEGQGLTEVSATTILSIQNDDSDTVANPANVADTDRYGFLDGNRAFNARDADTDFDRDLRVVADPADDIDDDASLTDIDDAGAAAPPLTILSTPLIPGCPAAQTVVQVSEIAPGGLTLDYQRDFYPAGDPTGHLVEGSSQSVRVIARFADDNSDGDRDDEGEYQDLSLAFTSSFGFDRDADLDCDVADLDPALAAPSPAYPEAVVRFALLFEGGGNRVSALADNPNDDADEPTLICARNGARVSPGAGYPARPGVLSNVLPLTVIDGPLTALRVAASDPCTADEQVARLCTPLDPPVTDPQNPTLRAGNLLTFTANGTFTSDAGANLEQPITPLVAWSSSNTALAVIGPGQGLAAGQLFALTDVQGSVTITARFVRGAVDTVPPTAGDAVDQVVESNVTIAPAGP